MEKQTTLVQQLDYYLGSLLDYQFYEGSTSPGQVVYDALLHMQNTPGTTVEETIGYIKHVSDTFFKKLEDDQLAQQEAKHYEDDLPF